MTTTDSLAAEIALVPQEYEAYVPFDQLTPHPANPNEGDLGLLDELLTVNGFAGAILAQKSTGLIIDGEQRREVAMSRGLAGGPVIWLDVSDDQAARFLASWNESGRRGTNVLGAMIALLQGLAATPQGLAGSAFDGDRLDEMIRDLNEPLGGGGGPGEDDAPDPPEEPAARPGDVWTLGLHRLLCGDATKREHVARLMGGERAPLMVTDPPYGVAYHDNKKGEHRTSTIHGDLTQAAIPLGFAVAVDVALDADARVYLFGGTANWPMYSALFDHHLRMQPRPIIWVKEHFTLHPTHYHSQYETVFFGWKGKGGGKNRWYGDRTGTDVWQLPRDPDRLHPTQKPVAVCAIPIRNSSPPGGLVYEPFAGSGSTLIAAEQAGRTCYAMEIDPAWVDVICQRYEQATGTPAVLEEREAG